MKLACNIRWRLRLELLQLHTNCPKTNVAIPMSQYFRRAGEALQGTTERANQDNRIQAAFVSKPKCMSMKNILAWDMQTWTKNEFTIRRKPSPGSGNSQILWLTVFGGSMSRFSYGFTNFYAFVMTGTGFQFNKNNWICFELCRQEMESAGHFQMKLSFFLLKANI